MKTLVVAMIAFVSTLFRSRRSLHFEIIALRHQLTVYQRTVKRPRIGPGDRVLCPSRESVFVDYIELSAVIRNP